MLLKLKINNKDTCYVFCLGKHNKHLNEKPVSLLALASKSCGKNELVYDHF